VLILSILNHPCDCLVSLNCIELPLGVVLSYCQFSFNIKIISYLSEITQNVKSQLSLGLKRFQFCLKDVEKMTSNNVFGKFYTKKNLVE